MKTGNKIRDKAKLIEREGEGQIDRKTNRQRVALRIVFYIFSPKPSLFKVYHSILVTEARGDKTWRREFGPNGRSLKSDLRKEHNISHSK